MAGITTCGNSMVVAEWAMVGCESTQSTDNVITINPASVTVTNDGATLASHRDAGDWLLVISYSEMRGFYP